MSIVKTYNININKFSPLLPPKAIKEELPLTENQINRILSYRQNIRNVLTGKDKRILLVVGPCSIHDPDAAIEYADRLSKISKQVEKTMMIVMRAYFEKPRSTIGWEGFIYDPYLDNSHDIIVGIRKSRKLLLDFTDRDLPCATEFLNPIIPQYIAGLISWAAIGARTTESQTHRQMVSGLSMPIGFKNSTDGGLQVAIDAMISGENPHSFLGIDEEGRSSIVETKGNQDVHIVLRGGGGGQSNCSRAHIAFTKVKLERKTDVSPKRLIMVDCSHGNSNKDFRKQPEIFTDLITQIKNGESSIMGLMLESNLEEGNQKISPQLIYGQSITDGCMGWNTTEKLIYQAHEQLK